MPLSHRGPHRVSRRAFGHAVAAAAAALAVPTATACAPGGSGYTEPGHLTLGVIPIIDIAPVQLGVERGYFADEGLTLALQESQGGAAIVPAVVSGSLQIGYSNLVSLMLAREQEVPVRMIAVGARASADALDDGSGQLMATDPGLTTVAGLRGRTVAVNTLLGINEVAVRTALARAGVPDGDVTLLEVPIPVMPAALAGGRVDAAMLSEPFITVAEAQGAHAVPVGYAAMGPRLPFAAWFTSESFAEEHPEVLAAFARALDRSLRYAEDHPDEARAVLNRYLPLADGVSDAVTLPGWDPTTERDELRGLAELTVAAGLLESAAPLDELLRS